MRFSLIASLCRCDQSQQTQFVSIEFMPINLCNIQQNFSTRLKTSHGKSNNCGVHNVEYVERGALFAYVQQQKSHEKLLSKSKNEMLLFGLAMQSML